MYISSVIIAITFQTIGSDPGSLGSVNQGFADISHLKDGWGFNVVPVLTGEGIDNLLFGSFLASFGEAL